MSRAGAAREALDRTGAELTWDMIEIALSAADAVMFSDEAVERVAESIYMTGPAADDAHWDDIGRQRQEWSRRRARKVIAALKGADA